MREWKGEHSANDGRVLSDLNFTLNSICVIIKQVKFIVRGV